MTDKSLRFVIDTNIWVSRLLNLNSIPGRAAVKAEQNAEILVSRATLAELFEVLSRAKLEKFVRPSERDALLNQVVRTAILIPIPSSIRACRDPKDDKFLEVAMHGRADLIVTGDLDLLALHPFRGVGILTPLDYLALE